MVPSNLFTCKEICFLLSQNITHKTTLPYKAASNSKQLSSTASNSTQLSSMLPQWKLTFEELLSSLSLSGTDTQLITFFLLLTVGWTALFWTTLVDFLPGVPSSSLSDMVITDTAGDGVSLIVIVCCLPCGCIWWWSCVLTYNNHIKIHTTFPTQKTTCECDACCQWCPLVFGLWFLLLLPE